MLFSWFTITGLFYLNEYYGFKYDIVETVSRLGTTEDILPFLSRVYYEVRPEDRYKFRETIIKEVAESAHSLEGIEDATRFLIGIARNGREVCTYRKMAVRGLGDLAEKSLGSSAKQYIINARGDECIEGSLNYQKGKLN